VTGPQSPRCCPHGYRDYQPRTARPSPRTGDQPGHGTSGSHFSGDLFLAFSTANPGAFRPGTQALSQLEFIGWEHLDPFFEAVVRATEEAVVNALVANEDMTGRDGHRAPALPRDKVVALLGKAGWLTR
jgi:Peptidase family S58